MCRDIGENMTHIALLGNSVIDNKAYVGRGPDVAEQVRNLVPNEWKVTRLAIDGAMARHEEMHISVTACLNDASDAKVRRPSLQ